MTTEFVLSSEGRDRAKDSAIRALANAKGAGLGNLDLNDGADGIFCIRTRLFK